MSKQPPQVFREIADLPTEAINPRTINLDRSSTLEILRMINREDRIVAPAVGKVLSHIARAVEIVVSAIRKGGRIYYVGAGTSGRLGVIDAAECPPTFGTPPELFQAIVAGGRSAVFRAKEGAEDRTGEARRLLARKHLRKWDVVIGLAACRRTPFVVAALESAKKVGARTVYVTCNPRGGIDADVVIVIDVGPEVIMGSTRMKCGTAEKMVLNMISTAAMVQLGKVYRNLMVDLMATSEKLRQRSLRTVMLATGCSYDEATRALKASGGSVKVAIVMMLKGVGKRKAMSLLKRCEGKVHLALEEER